MASRANTSIDTIADALNVEPIDAGAISVYEKKDTENISNDYEYSRGNLIDAIEKGNEALSTMLELASQSQHPRAFEVFATLLKTVTDSNKDLLELSRKKQLLDRENGDSRPNKVTNNLFVGSTHELQKLLKGEMKQDE
jgi:hypothetical protein